MIVVMVQLGVYQDQETVEETTVEYQDFQEQILMMVVFQEVQEVLRLVEVINLMDYQQRF